LRVDEKDRGETRVKTELVLKLLVISSLSPHETDGFVTEIINNSSDDFKVDGSFLFGGVNEFGKE
jgi:hypothetical protein